MAWPPRPWRPNGSRRVPNSPTTRTSTSSGSRSTSPSSSIARRASTRAFDLFAGTYAEQQKRGAALGLNPLVAAYGPALLDRAILDALGRATGKSFAAMIAGNLPGIRATSLTPDIADAELAPFLAGLKPGAEHRRAPYGRAGRSADGGRPAGVGTRQ